MKKFISLVLALLMTISAASFVGAAEEPAIAEDAATTTAAAETTAAGPYDEAIKFLESYGIYKGTSALTFVADADSPIERYQMALFVARISTGWVDDAKWAVYDEWHDGPENRNENRSIFDDLAGTYAEKVYGAISYANQKGIILGYGNGKFGPTDGITYQDALTMICRTLGYKDLKWPWGFIEKAVTLDLTKGIPSTVAYTDKLNRGEVAQLIYNALFAKTYEGDTLAARNFNGELGWETIIVTVAGRGRYIADNTLTGYNFPTDAGNKIGFNVVKEDGTLDATTYYVKNDDDVSFKFDNHKERYLGYAFKALFTKDENSEYVTMISLKPLYEGTVKNEGLLKKDADGKYPIVSFLADKTLVSKFSKNTYLNTLNGAYGVGEFILKSGLQSSTVTVDAGRKYAIDWITGNILELNADDKGKILADIGKIDGIERTYSYNVAWYYNSTLGEYFKFKVDDKNDEIVYVGIDILDPNEIKSMIENSRLTKDAASRTGLTDITSKNVANTAYASLTYFSIPGYSTPNYGLFEEYRFGYYTEAKKAGDADHEAESYVLSSLDAVAKPMYEELNPGKTYSPANVVFHKEGSCGKNDAVGFLSEDGITDVKSGSYVIYSADKGTGEIKIVKVIYDVTDEKADKDNFVATGVVRAYNVPNMTVTIGDKQYSYDYQDLAGNPFYYSGATNATWGPLYRAAFTRYFKSLFNQYVKYVVVDGKLVWIELAGKQDNIIIVDSYAGLSSDGFIVVNGYKTPELEYTQIRIGSYDGWVKGDYYYYLTDQKVEDSFERGSLYRITSYDDAKDVYYVYTVGKHFVGVPEGTNIGKLADGTKYVLHYHDKNGKIIEIEDTYHTNLEYDAGTLARLNDVYGFAGEPVTITLKEGYRSVNGGSTYTKRTSKDKYIFVCNPIDNDDKGYVRTYDNAGGDYAPIIVYTGSGMDGWEASGYRIKNIGDNANTFVLVGVDLTQVIGFNVDQYMMSYVLFLHYDYETANYNGADSTGWYLLGASNFTARVFNFYNGEIEVKNATNKDLKIGYIYPSVSGWIVNDAEYLAYEMNTEIPGAYQWQYEYNAKNPLHYMFGQHNFSEIIESTPLFDGLGNVVKDSDGYTKTHSGAKAGVFSSDGDTWKAAVEKLTKEKNFSMNVLSKDKGLTIKVDDLVSSIKFFFVDPDRYDALDRPLSIGEITKTDRDGIRDWIIKNNIDYSKLTFWYICDKDGNVVVYINKDAAKYKDNKAPVVADIATGYVEVTSSQNNKNKADKDCALIAATVSGVLKDAKLVDDKTADQKIYLRDTTLIYDLRMGGVDVPADVVEINYKGHKIEGGNVIQAITFEWTGAATEENHKAVDLDDFHFGRTDDCDKINWNAIISYKTKDAYRVYDNIKNDCIVTGLYDDHSHDAVDEPAYCDLIKKITFPIDDTKIAMPDWEDLAIINDNIPEMYRIIAKCHDSMFYTGWECGCEFNHDLMLASINFNMDPAYRQELVDWLNYQYAMNPTKTEITVEFWDSNATKYEFTIVVYAYAVAKAETNKYGHTEFLLDHVEYAADITECTITGSNFDYSAPGTEGSSSWDADYMDLEVDTTAYAENPEFGLILTYGDAIADASGKLAYIPVTSKLGYKIAGGTKKIAKDAQIAVGGIVLPDGTTYMPAGGKNPADKTYDTVGFGIMLNGAAPTIPAIGIPAATVVPLDDTFLAYYKDHSIPADARK